MPINDVAELLRMDVCPVGLFSPLVLEIMRLYNASQTRALPWAVDEESALLARGFSVINSELAAIQREQQVKQDGKQREI